MTPEQTPWQYTSEELIERGIACQHYTPPIICSLCALDLIRAERKARELLEKQKASLIVERDNALERREKAETALKAMAEPISKQKQTHTHDLGVNSDPDHCLDCCDEKYEGACEIARKWAHQAGENRERAEKSEAKLRIAEKAFENQLGPCQFSDVSAGEGYTYQAHINGIRDRMMAVAEQALKAIREVA